MVLEELHLPISVTNPSTKERNMAIKADDDNISNDWNGVPNKNAMVLWTGFVNINSDSYADIKEVVEF